MKTLKTILSLFLLGMGISARAQTEIAYDSTTDIHKYSYRAEQYDYRTNGQQNSYHTVSIKGSPFLTDHWQRGSIPFLNRRSIHVPIRYNILEDLVLVKLPEGDKIIFPESFLVEGKTFLRIDNHYYEVLYPGSIKFLRRYTARLDKVERNGYNENIQYDFEYSKSENLYLQTDNGSPVSVKLSERSLLSRLPEALAAKEIIRKHKLKLRSHEDVITLLAQLEE